LTREPRSAGSVLRKIVAAVILVPLAIVIIAFAVANRQMVTVSFDPFNSGPPASSLSLPLFVLVIGLVIGGVVIGGAASWLRHGHLRRTVRRFERDIRELRGELASLRHSPSGVANVPEAGNPPERLKLRAPVQ
jgi:uncharacterized integral membrane protein